MKTILKRQVLLFIFLIPALISFSQYPGGVSSNLNFWSKANASSGKITFSGSKISSWQDEKSTFSVTQATASKQPVWSEGSSASLLFNYNPYITFNTTNQTSLYNSATTPNLASTAPTIFVASTSDANEFDAFTYYSSTSYKYQIKPGFRVQSCNSTLSGYTSDPPTELTNTIAHITVLKNNGASLVARRDATQYALTNNSVLYNPVISPGLCIGSNNNSEWFGGTIAEVLVYNAVLNNQSQYQVESYLALKYGLTLDRAGSNYNYYNSAGASIFPDGSDAGLYWNQIIGIARDSVAAGGALNQKQSHQPDDSTRIYLGTLQASNDANTTTFANNISSVVIGNNKGNLCSIRGAYITQLPSGVPVRLDREWKIQVTGATASTFVNDNFNMDVTLSSCANGSSTYGGGSAATLGLLVNSTSDLTTGQFFPNPTIYNGVTMSMTLNSATGIITIKNLNAGLMAYRSSTAGLSASNTPLYFTIAALDAGVLPVKLLSFMASPAGQSVNIGWGVVSASDIKEYIIERSNNGLDWFGIKTLLSKDNGDEKQSYLSNDENPLPGISYYRLKMVDYNGNISFSEIQKVFFEINNYGIASISPNPFHSSMYVKFSLLTDDNKIKIRVTDMIGKTVAAYNLAGKSGENIFTLYNLGNIPSGMYVVEVTGSSINSKQKVIRN